MSGVVNKGNYFASMAEAWSYTTCIRTVTADGIFVINRTHYSKSTETHQKLDAAIWRGRGKYVIVQNAKQGAGPADLLELAQEGLREIRSGVPDTQDFLYQPVSEEASNG